MQKGWLLSRKSGEKKEYARACDTGFYWTENSGEGIAFLNRKSAEQVADILENENVSIEAHVFGEEISDIKTAKTIDLWTEAAHRHQQEQKELPVVIGVPIYSFFGNSAMITDINIYGPGGAECTVEGPFGEHATVEREDLSLATRRQQ